MILNVDQAISDSASMILNESDSVANLYSNKQIRMLSVPILGGTTAVKRGEVILIAAGIRTAFELAEPVLKDLSAQIFYLGSDHRTASAAKLAININIALIALALAEGLVFARGTGVDAGTFVS
jgi:3-hydroxyisobutyrate dehydrogenase-like beta-hydroxyacid dehydrogenase